MMGFSKGRYIKFYTFITSTKPLTIIYSKKKKKNLTIEREKKRRRRNGARGYTERKETETYRRTTIWVPLPAPSLAVISCCWATKVL